jgi:hypothetical protein
MAVSLRSLQSQRKTKASAATYMILNRSDPTAYKFRNTGIIHIEVYNCVRFLFTIAISLKKCNSFDCDNEDKSEM